MVHLTGEAGNYAVYNWYTGELSMLAESNHLVAGYEGHIYAVVAPVKQGWIFLGETDKYVTAARIRFPLVKVLEASAGEGGGANLEVHVAGTAGEDVKVCAAKTAALQVLCQTVHFGSKETRM